MRAARAPSDSRAQSPWFSKDTPYSLVFSSTHHRFHRPKISCDSCLERGFQSRVWDSV